MFGLFLFHQNPALFTGLADGLVIDHLWLHVVDHLDGAGICVASENKARVEQWLAGRSDRLSKHVSVIAVEPDLSEIEVVAAFAPNLPNQDLIVLSDQVVTIAPFEDLPAADEEIILIGDADGGPIWFRRGQNGLTPLLSQSAETLRQSIDVSGGDPAKMKPKKFLPVLTADERLHANLRLLGIGYTSNNALERSYTEEFAVIPPVFIHPDAEIYASMIGPYVSIGAGAVVERCVLENTIIGAQAKITNLNLKDSLVQDAAIHSGEAAMIRE